MGKALCWGAGRPTPGSVSRASRDGPLGSPPPSPREMPPSMSSSGPCPLLLERVPPAGHQCPNATPGEHHAPHHSHSGNFKIFFLCFYYGTFQKLVLKKKKKKHVPLPSFKIYENFIHLISFPPHIFCFLKYFKANLRHHLISPVNTSICISNR